MDAQRLIEGTWLKDWHPAIIAYSELPDDDLLITVREFGGEVAIALFNVKLLNRCYRSNVETRLRQFHPGIDDMASKAGVDLRGVLIRIMDTGWNWGHVDSDNPELRLSLLSGWRGHRLMDNAADMLTELALKCGSQASPGKDDTQR